MVDKGLDEELLTAALRARDRMVKLQRQTDQARVVYQHAIRLLHFHGSSMREIADGLGLSYQRVHQMIDLSAGKGPLKRRAAACTCSFCAAPGDAGQVIAGPWAQICSGCVGLAQEVISDSVPRANAATFMTPVAPGGKGRCVFCGRKRAGARRMAWVPGGQSHAAHRGRRAGARARICAECVCLAAEMLAEGTNGA
ncbi:MAG: hypothetical protein M0T77_09145 [Actinomycetota bacterium]|nr:hypothetical protein [Actinomycetota bacterium]